VERDFDQPIPVAVENQPPSTSLAEGWQQEVRIRLRAPQSVWNQLSVDDFTAVLDLSPNLNPLEPGQYDVEVQVFVDVEPADLLQIEPHFVRIELEAITERSVPVNIEVSGEPDRLSGGSANRYLMMNLRSARVDQVVQAVSASLCAVSGSGRR
jgi:YbbR domain-containing protein